MRNAFPLFLAGCCIVLIACATKSGYYSEAQSRITALGASHPDSERVTSVRALPTAIRERLGLIADTNESFSARCTDGFPHSRFLGATKSGRTYFVAVEHGGVAYFWDLTEYVLDENGRIKSEHRVEPIGTANAG